MGLRYHSDMFERRTNFTTVSTNSTLSNIQKVAKKDEQLLELSLIITKIYSLAKQESSKEDLGNLILKEHLQCYL